MENLPSPSPALAAFDQAVDALRNAPMIAKVARAEIALAALRDVLLDLYSQVERP